MNMNPNIILAGRQPDIIGSMSKGHSAADVFNKIQERNREVGFLNEYGQALYSGDQGALQAYAQINPEKAFAWQQQHEQVAMQKQKAAAAAAATKKVEETANFQRKADALQGVRDLAVSRFPDDPEKQNEFFHSSVRQILRPETVEMFDKAAPGWGLHNVDVLGMKLANMTGITWNAAKQADGDQFTLGKGQVRYDSAGNPIASNIPGATDSAEPPEIKEFFDEEGRAYKAQWNAETRAWDRVGGSKAEAPLSPIGKVFADINSGKIPPAHQADAIAKAMAAEEGMTVNLGAQEKAFEKKAGEVLATSLGELMKEGSQAGKDLASLNRLEELISDQPTGIGAAITSIAADWGIKLEGADTVEGIKAILDQLTPQQRQGMPGAASDRDVAMFRGSLPKLINTPRGNKIVIDTLRGFAKFKEDRAAIASRALYDNEYTPKMAMEDIKKLTVKIDTKKIEEVTGDAVEDVEASTMQAPAAFLNDPRVKKMAEENKIDARKIWNELPMENRAPFMGWPPIGHIEDGYKLLRYPPNKKENWGKADG